MILSYAIWIPIFFGLIILFYGSEKPSAGVRWLALFGAILGFVAVVEDGEGAAEVGEQPPIRRPP